MDDTYSWLAQQKLVILLSLLYLITGDQRPLQSELDPWYAELGSVRLYPV